MAAPRPDATKRQQPLPRAPEAPTHAPDLTLLARPRRGLAAQAAKGTHGQATASGSWATLGAASRGPRGGRPRHPTCFGALGWPTAYRLRLPALRDAHPRPHPISTARLRVPRRSSGGTRCATAQAVRHRPALATRSHEGRRSTACLAHHKARGLAARCAAAPLPPGRAGPCACCASATPRRACGRSTPTRRGWAPRLLRSLRSLRIGGGRAPCGRLFRAHGLRPSARRPPAVARVLAPARPLRAAYGGGLRPALPGLCALAGRVVGARGRPGP